MGRFRVWFPKRTTVVRGHRFTFTWVPHWWQLWRWPLFWWRTWCALRNTTVETSTNGVTVKLYGQTIAYYVPRSAPHG